MKEIALTAFTQIGATRILMEECIVTDLMGDIIGQAIEMDVFIMKGCRVYEEQK